jgi:hypothetical protein
MTSPCYKIRLYMLNHEHYNLPHQGPKVASVAWKCLSCLVVKVDQYGYIMYNVFLKPVQIRCPVSAGIRDGLTFAVNDSGAYVRVEGQDGWSCRVREMHGLYSMRGVYPHCKASSMLDMHESYTKLDPSITKTQT